MMKTFRLLLGFIIIFPMICPAQKKELLIIGTMHTVPYIVKNAYRPLLKYAIDCVRLYSYMCRPMLQCRSGERVIIHALRLFTTSFSHIKTFIISNC